MQRRRRSTGHPLLSALLTLCVAALGLVVLWHLGHAYLEDDADAGPGGDNRPVTAFVTTDEVNLRSGPGLGHEILRVLPPTTTVAVTGEAREGFRPVRIDGREAWVSADFLIREGSALARTEEVALVAAPTAEPTSVPDPVTEGAVAEVPPPPAPESGKVETRAGSMDAPVVTSAPVTIDAPAPRGERWIEINRTRRTVTLHDGDVIVGVFDALLGKDPSTDGYYATATGTFHVHVKNRELTETPFAPGAYLTDFVGFDPERSNGIHSPVRDAQGNVVATGGTTTLGCVRVGEEQARTVYDFAEIGMRVEVHD